MASRGGAQHCAEPPCRSEALAEYRALSHYFVGAEACVRYGVLLAKMGRQGEAKAWLSEVLRQLRRSPAQCAQGAGGMDRDCRKDRQGMSLKPPA